jgi:carbon-monoxide dehydrogenase large subunit
MNLSYNAATSVPGPYRLANYRMHVQVVETNRVPTMPVRGAGYPEGTFAMERLLDRAAQGLGLDRAEIRRRNLITPDEMPYETPMKTRAGTPVKYDSGDFPKCQQMALDAIGYQGFAERQARALQDGRHIGIGIANATKGTGRGPFETGIVRVGRSGKVSVYSGAAPMGQGTKTMLAQLAAEQFGIAPEDVNVVLGDTATVPMGHGGFASRQAINAGSSVHVAATEVRRKALHVASQLLSIPADDLEIMDGHIFPKGGSNVSLALGDIAREASGIPGYSLPKGIEPGLEYTSNFMPAGLAYGNTTHAVEVEVDPELGLVTISRYLVVSDCGRLINPMIAEGQIVGGVVHGIGNALFEWMGYDENAQPVSTNFGDYLLPGSAETPRIEVIHHITPSPLNPLGIKGVGEIGVVPVAAAVISAVEDALRPFGLRIAETPILPQRITELLDACQSARPALRDSP